MRESFSKSPYKINQFIRFSFAREDEGSPRQDILEKFCASDVKNFRACMTANGNDENKCMPTKLILDKCAALAFKEVNSAGKGNFVYWSITQEIFDQKVVLNELAKWILRDVTLHVLAGQARTNEVDSPSKLTANHRQLIKH